MSINTKKLAAIALMLSSSAAFAGPLNEYNLILSGDFDVDGQNNHNTGYTSGHIEGRSFIGGNVVNGSIFSQFVPQTSDSTVKVVGNFNANHLMHVESGYVAYGGTTNVEHTSSWNSICNGNGLRQNADCFKHVTDGSLAAEKAAIFTDLQEQSDYFKSLTTSVGAFISGNYGNKAFVYQGASTDLAVFNVNASDLKNVNWSADFGLASNIVINVSGTVFDAGYAHFDLLQPKAGNVLWNFTDATHLNLDAAWYGSILALNAEIRTPNNLNGAVAAKTYLGNGEIHTGYQWSYEIPEPPVPPVSPVPEPSSLLVSLLGLGLILLGRKLRK